METPAWSVQSSPMMQRSMTLTPGASEQRAPTLACSPRKTLATRRVASPTTAPALTVQLGPMLAVGEILAAGSTEAEGWTPGFGGGGLAAKKSRALIIAKARSP